MAKKDFRIYCEEDYIDHLKTIADEKGTSVNQLVMTVLTKKYPLPKRKKDQTSTGPTLDIEATKKHYEALNQFLTEAENGGAKIKPYALYQHLVAERDRLRNLLDISSQT